MPPYFSVDISFDRGRVKPGFVESIYHGIIASGYPFLAGYGLDQSHSQATLEKIIEVNQRKLEQNFKLGFTQHCKHDYI